MKTFTEEMNEMREAAKAALVGTESARRGVSFSNNMKSLLSLRDGIAEPLSEQGVNTVEEFQAYTQGQGNDLNDDIRIGISESTEELQKDNVTSEAQARFKEQMEAQRKKAKEEADKRIDQIFDTAIDIGNENPSLQPVIQSSTDIAMNGIFEIYDSIVSFIGGVVESIVTWIKTAWQSIENTFTSIASTISNWFGGWFTVLRIV